MSAILNSLKLISRKNGVVEKFSNFHILISLLSGPIQLREFVDYYDETTCDSLWQGKSSHITKLPFFLSFSVCLSSIRIPNSISTKIYTLHCFEGDRHCKLIFLRETEVTTLWHKKFPKRFSQIFLSHCLFLQL